MLTCVFTVYPAVPLQGQNRVIAAETLWPPKMKVFAIWPFTERVCQTLEWQHYRLSLIHISEPTRPKK